MESIMNSECRSVRAVHFIIPILAILTYLIASIIPAQAESPDTGDYYMRSGLDPEVSAAIEDFRTSVPGVLKKDKVPGASMALVDDRGAIWMEGFGHTGGKKKSPVSPDTRFPLGGISRFVIATAVMASVQEGLVSLDEPITTYLPDFRIKSPYEAHPERKITLRHLLNNTAGIPDAAPRGNFLEPETAASFEDHVRSLYDGWLVCPVGGGYHPSTESFELAAYVVSMVSGQSFELYMHEKLFVPLGMNRTTVDGEQIKADTERAYYSMSGVTKSPGLPPGTIYSTARDMGRLIQLHINRGTIDGRTIIERPLMETIQAPVTIKEGDWDVYYGEGIIIDKRWPELTETILHHGGWSVGFNAFLHWYPEYGIGAIVMTNRLPGSAASNLGLTLTDTLTKGKFLDRRFPDIIPSSRDHVHVWEEWSGHKPTPYKPEWKQYCGKHNLIFDGFKLKLWLRMAIFVLGKSEYTPRVHVREKDGYMCSTVSKLIASFSQREVKDEKLQEVKPGVFITRTGETFDFTREVPTWYNFRLK